jgi:predicted amidophosphoribosyltransferase
VPPAELLARRVARHLRVPCRRLLVRAPGPAQTGRSAADRWAGPAFTARWAARGTVLVVDDVVTTGATMAAAARSLRSVGAEQVVVLALARTPLKAAT